MDAIIFNNWNDFNLTTVMNKLGKLNTISHWEMYNPYLFLRRELEVTNKEEFHHAKYYNQIRHCKPYKGGWLDYITKTEYNTLQEWVEDCHAKIEDILYGVNRVYKDHEPQYVLLSELLTTLGYTEPEINSFRDILDELGAEKLPPQGNKCLVQRPNGTIVIGRVVNQKYYSMDEYADDTVVLVLVPRQDNPHEPRLEYEHLSDLPEGMKIYFRSLNGEFMTIEDLLAGH